MYESFVCVGLRHFNIFLEIIVFVNKAAVVHCNFKFRPAKYKVGVALLFLYIQSGAKVT